MGYPISFSFLPYKSIDTTVDAPGPNGSPSANHIDINIDHPIKNANV